jgi:putative DNA primase/helicase
VTFEHIPGELRELPRWVVFRWGEVDPKTRKRRKPPLRIDGAGHASSTDPQTWGTFADAVATVEAGKADGIGFALCPPYTLVDLDAGLDEADRTSIARELSSYTEWSVSGDGWHVIVRGSLNGHPRNREGAFEVYDSARFCYCTGRHVAGTPKTIEDRQNELEAVIAKRLPPRTSAIASARSVSPTPIALEDEELLEVARKLLGEKFVGLWEGSWESRYATHSEADLALCSWLAWLTGRDATRVERMFCASGLHREKWERKGYRERTIALAIEGTHDVYRPDNGKPPAGGKDLLRSETREVEAVSPAEDQEEPEPFIGRTHADVLDLSFDDEGPPELIEGLVPRGVLELVAGLPETFKGWVCAQLAANVAAGAGELFGHEVLVGGPAGYFWQDDSTRNEAERVQLFARVHETPRDLPLRWFLNEGLSLPDDIERLRTTIEHHGFVLVVLDSLYNVVPELDLRDREVGQLFAKLKAEICDATGCTVVLVDHMPWATEQNRKRLRSYGDVFKGAAARAGIYIDAEGSKLYVEARGNSIAGFKRTPAYWDADALELRLVEKDSAEEQEAKVAERAEKVLAWLVEHAERHSTNAIRKAMGGRATLTDKALLVLEARDEVQTSSRSGGTWSGRSGDARYWIASIHAGLRDADTSSQLFGTRSDEVAGESHDDEPRPAPFRGGEVNRDEVPDKAVSAGPLFPERGSSTASATPARATDDLAELVGRVMP